MTRYLPRMELRPQHAQPAPKALVHECVCARLVESITRRSSTTREVCDEAHSTQMSTGSRLVGVPCDSDEQPS